MFRKIKVRSLTGSLTSCVFLAKKVVRPKGVISPK